MLNDASDARPTLTVVRTLLEIALIHYDLTSHKMNKLGRIRLTPMVFPLFRLVTLSKKDPQKCA